MTVGARLATIYTPLRMIEIVRGFADDRFPMGSFRLVSNGESGELFGTIGAAIARAGQLADRDVDSFTHSRREAAREAATQAERFAYEDAVDAAMARKQAS